MGQGPGKSYTVGNAASLDADTMTKAFISLGEDRWFEKMKVDDPDRRQKLIDAINKHHILRFVGAPNLDLKAASVKQAISALGPNTPLATIDLHAFQADFLTKYEHENVLTPMEHWHALASKQVRWMVFAELEMCLSFCLVL